MSESILGRIAFDTANALNNEALVKILREENEDLKKQLAEKKEHIRLLEQSRKEIFEDLGRALGKASKLSVAYNGEKPPKSLADLLIELAALESIDVEEIKKEVMER